MKKFSLSFVIYVCNGVFLAGWQRGCRAWRRRAIPLIAGSTATKRPSDSREAAGWGNIQLSLCHLRHFQAHQMFLCECCRGVFFSKKEDLAGVAVSILPHSEKVPRSSLGCGFAAWSLHVLLVHVWVLSGNSDFFPPSKNMYVRLG